MKGSKKAVAGLLALSAVSVVGLAGCGSTASNSNNSTGTSTGSKPVTISIYVQYVANAAKQQADMMNNKIIPEFEKQNPGIKVTWSYYTDSTQENQQLQTAVATHQGPDIFELGTTMVPTAYATGAFHVLSASDWAAVGGKSRFFPAQLGMSGPDANHYIAVPEFMYPFAMLYNTSLFKQAGISSPPTTWTQFVTDAQKMTDPSKNVWGAAIDPADGFDPWKIGWMFSNQLGSDLLSSDLKTATVNTNADAQGINFWFDWVTKYKIASPNDLTWKSSDELSAFENGKLGMMLLATASSLPTLETSAVKNDYAVAPMPSVPYGMTSRPAGGVPAQTIVSGNDLAIPSYVTGAKYQDALKFINFLTNVQQQQTRFTMMGAMPVNMSAYASSSSFSGLNTPAMKAFYKAELGAQATPFSGAWGNLETVYGGVFNSIATKIATNSFKSTDVKALLDAANSQIQASLK